MRGLKPKGSYDQRIVWESHLLQMRGLKLINSFFLNLPQRRIFYRCVDWNILFKIFVISHIVASFTDAWIETPKAPATPVAGEVASFTDAWIETWYTCRKSSTIIVASFTDAWIETCGKIYCCYTVSRRIFYRCVDWNPIVTRFGVKRKVASFTDAWIETALGLKPLKRKICRIFYRCVDWNFTEEEARKSVNGRIFYRCVDWNLWGIRGQGTTVCRIFYRCVDWNIKCRTSL